MNLKEDRENAELRIQAELQVEAFVSLLTTRYNLKPEDIPQIVDDMRWVRQHRTGISRIQWSVALGILALAISGVWQALITGIKQTLTR